MEKPNSAECLIGGFGKEKTSRATHGTGPLDFFKGKAALRIK